MKFKKLVVVGALLLTTPFLMAAEGCQEEKDPAPSTTVEWDNDCDADDIVEGDKDCEGIVPKKTATKKPAPVKTKKK
jgi:hypothetical protein